MLSLTFNITHNLFMYIKNVLTLLLAVAITGTSVGQNRSSDAKKMKQISVAELRDKIAGAWIGQMIGNIYGLPHENKYVNAPGPEKWPYGYTKNLDKLKNYDGAFSDDDTDV